RRMPLLVEVGNGFVPDIGFLEAFAMSQISQGAIGPARDVVRGHIKRRVRRMDGVRSDIRTRPQLYPVVLVAIASGWR
ncbi:hypothetical protein NM04_20270, partial [Massilia aurea]